MLHISHHTEVGHIGHHREELDIELEGKKLTQGVRQLLVSGRGSGRKREVGERG